MKREKNLMSLSISWMWEKKHSENFNSVWLHKKGAKGGGLNISVDTSLWKHV
jgi:hypothetical protein